MSLPKKPKITEKERNSNTSTESQKLLDIENELCIKLNRLEFPSPIEFVYNPLIYARVLHELFVTKYFEHSAKKILFLGMNPGPWGMGQTGIFFGERDFVKDWLNIDGPVEKPENEHPKRKVKGLDCHRSEESGKRLWGFFKTMCTTPENFFKHSFVYNYCPLAFLSASGRNITPPEIKDKKVRHELFDICNEAFVNIIKEFSFETVISIGDFAEKRALSILQSSGITNVTVRKIPHPSPRNRKNSLTWKADTFKILNDNNLIGYFNEDPNFDGAIFGASRNAPQ